MGIHTCSESHIMKIMLTILLLFAIGLVTPSLGVPQGGIQTRNIPFWNLRQCELYCELHVAHTCRSDRCCSKSTFFQKKQNGKLVPSLCKCNCDCIQGDQRCGFFRQFHV